MEASDIEDLFAPFCRVSVRRMFGGKGIYANGLMFALEAGGEIFLKTDDQSRPAFEAEDLRPFVYNSPRGPTATSYWQLAEAAHDDEAELRRWCIVAIDAAQRVNAAKKPKAALRKMAAKPNPATTRKPR